MLTFMTVTCEAIYLVKVSEGHCLFRIKVAILESIATLNPASGEEVSKNQSALIKNCKNVASLSVLKYIKVFQ